MNTSNQFRLEDAKKKLSCFSLRLENLVRSACNSAISAEDILSAVSEIEYLISWAAGQPELVSEYDILMMKLEQLHRIRENRERIDMQLVEKNNRLIKVNSFLRESQRVVETQAGSPGVGSRPPSVTAVSENPSQQKGPLNEQSKQSKHYSRTKMPEMKTQEETVATLRAQVRELQSQLERISDDDPLEIETPKQFPLTSRTVCKGYEEDFDYAEVEDCLDVRTRPEGCSPAKHVYDLDEGKINYKFEDTDRENKQPGVKQAEEENDYDEILPRPTNFRVVQQVGTDTLLLGWNYVNPAVLDGYEVYVENHVHERIYTADRTKALISGLNLRKPIVLSICALSSDGQISEPVSLEYLPRSHSSYFENEYDDYYECDDSDNKQRPYSMEW